MTLKEARKLIPGIYEITFKKEGEKSLAAIGSDNENNPWFAAVDWTGSTDSQWDEVKSVCQVIPNQGLLPK